ncbi:MAG: bifunctional DNA-formamidopyrimidine glycosylase/DNA-(apurinic or apyrimidinic site) lyase [Pseudomonadota bacterium]
MPELPEVETTRRGVLPHLENTVIRDIVVRDTRLRWPVPVKTLESLIGSRISTVERRAKYLYIVTDAGNIIIHLGMSGRLQVMPATTAPKKHDHVDIVLDSGEILRLNDPRRFGCVLFSKTPETHDLIRKLGPEPLSDDFDGDYLWHRARGKRVAIKPFIMDAQVVVGVGNIYASEALFMAGIHPLVSASKVSKARMAGLADAVKVVLDRAIKAGGTTLRDFYGSDGSPGYFTQELAMYGRGGAPCPTCEKPITQRVIGQRSTFYCTRCQH